MRKFIKSVLTVAVMIPLSYLAAISGVAMADNLHDQFINMMQNEIASNIGRSNFKVEGVMNHDEFKQATSRIQKELAVSTQIINHGSPRVNQNQEIGNMVATRVITGGGKNFFSIDSFQGQNNGFCVVSGRQVDKNLMISCSKKGSGKVLMAMMKANGKFVIGVSNKRKQPIGN